LASYLIDVIQVEKGENIAILSESKPEYGACVFGSVLAGLTTVPAVINNVDDNEAAERAIVENVQRSDLTAIEEARS
jgi:acyl-CoA synthetase (AMP-forming)/AMP-acid ligase II